MFDRKALQALGCWTGYRLERVEWPQGEGRTLSLHLAPDGRVAGSCSADTAAPVAGRSVKRRFVACAICRCSSTGWSARAPPPVLVRSLRWPEAGEADVAGALPANDGAIRTGLREAVAGGACLCAGVEGIAILLMLGWIWMSR